MMNVYFPPSLTHTWSLVVYISKYRVSAFLHRNNDPLRTAGNVEEAETGKFARKRWDESSFRFADLHNCADITARSGFQVMG